MYLFRPDLSKKKTFLVAGIVRYKIDALKPTINKRLTDRLYLPPWEKTDDSLKVYFYNLALDLRFSVNFTVNLSEGVHLACKRAKKGYASHLQERLSKILKRKLGKCPEFYFSIETDTAVPHIHGAIQMPPTPSNIALLKTALETLGGKDAYKEKIKRQVKIDELDFIENWPSYSTKIMAKAKKDLGERPISSTAFIKKIGKMEYEQFREYAQECDERFP